MSNKPILCVDFDGVLHSYTSPWQGAEIISDPPTPGAMEWLARAIDHFHVYVYSSRSRDARGVLAMQGWLERHAYELLDGKIAEKVIVAVTFAHEKPAAFLTIDDRAVCFDGDWSKLAPEILLKFKPWNKQ